MPAFAHADYAAVLFVCCCFALLCICSPVSAPAAAGSVPSLGRRGYLFLKEDKGFSDTSIISGVLLVPLLFGALFICVLDAIHTRRHLPFEPEHEHHE